MHEYGGIDNLLLSTKPVEAIARYNDHKGGPTGWLVRESLDVVRNLSCAELGANLVFTPEPRQHAPGRVERENLQVDELPLGRNLRRHLVARAWRQPGAFHQLPSEIGGGLRNGGEDLGQPVLPVQDVSLRSLEEESRVSAHRVRLTKAAAQRGAPSLPEMRRPPAK